MVELLSTKLKEGKIRQASFLRYNVGLDLEEPSHLSGVSQLLSFVSDGNTKLENFE